MSATPRFGLDVGTTGEWSDPGTLVELAIEAEAAGWDGFFLWDILLPEDPESEEPIADPLVALAAIAARTSRIRLGALVTPLPRRRPWKVAREVATLDHLSGGRIIFGAGLGWQRAEFDRLGEESDPRVRAAKLDESLAILDAAWRGDRVDHAGTHYRVEGLALHPPSVQRPRPPIWVAAGWPRRRPLQRAAAWDGVYLMTDNQATGERMTPDDVAAAAGAIRGLRGSLDGFDVAANIYTAELSPTDARAAASEMAAAGATWLTELTPDTVEEHRATIRRGPPR
jgi:alkanesulfonate monooxygenase SsuD/methylene tetrahydromethanopterin reductase-like flavin-dependent oxidoreductase (luciferase family)